MRRVIFIVISLLGISSCALGQTPSPDSQTLQALLSEVRALRQDLRVSLNRTQTMQILLARFQMQEGVVTRASDRLNDSRQKWLDAYAHQKELAVEAKKTEDALNAAENQQEQKHLQTAADQMKSNLEIAGNVTQQRQATEIQAEQQLREEQDKLGVLENQLDDLIRSMSTQATKP